MKKINNLVYALLAASALLLTSCGPEAYTMWMEMRKPSASGLDLGRKTFSVAYLDDGITVDTIFNNRLASGFARRLEENYFRGDEIVGIYSVPARPGADYSSRDSLINLIMDTGSDVVFFFDKPELGSVTVPPLTKVQKPSSPDSAFFCNASVPFSTVVYAYDSMNKKDEVRRFSGKSNLMASVYSDGKESREEIADRALKILVSSAEVAGYSSGTNFIPKWEEENLTFVYYTAQPWLKAIECVDSFKWEEAIEHWLTQVGSKSAEKRSCAQYNIALACYMMGEYQLALEWLDLSDKTRPVSLSRTLRARIKSIVE